MIFSVSDKTPCSTALAVAIRSLGASFQLGETYLSKRVSEVLFVGG